MANKNTEIQFMNTLGRKKEVFKPIKEGHVGMYSCGLTVYYYPHIGNLRVYVFADTLKRMFLFNKYTVKHVINITDVGHLTSDEDEGEDKVSKEAKKEGKTALEISEHYTNAFMDDLDAMNILRPEHMPKATEHIKDMIDLNKRLEKNGFTYVSDGNLYFDTTKYKDYGKLAKLNLDEDAAKSRTGKDPAKHNYFDFALWLTNHKYKNHEMIWDSPWGKGFPGWHIECSAMSSKYLGEQFDIHTGGIDLIPVHHVNEIAQSEAAFGHNWVNYWLHSDWLVIGNDEKMSKSVGNVIRLKNLESAGFSAMEFRYYLLQTHYRKKVPFSKENLGHAKNAFKKLKNKVFELKDIKDEIEKIKVDEYIEKFRKEINDDLNIPNALALMWNMLDSKINASTKIAILKEFDNVFGLRILEFEDEKIPIEILNLKEKRDTARRGKDWKKADELRDILLEKGYEVRDDKDGSLLKKL